MANTDILYQVRDWQWISFNSFVRKLCTDFAVL